MAVDNVTAVAATAPLPPVQPLAQTPNGIATGPASNPDSLNVFEQAVALNNLQQSEAFNANANLNLFSSASGSSAGGDSASLDGAILTNLSPQALSVLNEVDSSLSGSSGVVFNGHLTPLQKEEIAVLQTDAQLLNDVNSSTVTTTVSAAGSTDTVNLSVQANNIVNGVTPVETTETLTVGALTPAQLQQVANILAPFLSQPLTQDTFLQMQAALTAAGFNPTQLSFQTLYLSMNYQAELMPIEPQDAEQLAANEAMAVELDDS